MAANRPNPFLKNPIGQEYISPRCETEIKESLRGMEGCAWRDRGYVCIHISDLADNDLLMKSVEARMNRLHGVRSNL
mgnify:CR=1 FL=1